MVTQPRKSAFSSPVTSALDGDDHVIGGFPIEAAGDVGELGGEAVGFVGLDLPAQGGLEQQSIGGGGKQREVREAGTASCH